jgi:drug/metabolite transporter (DMT)-like permease
MGVALALLGMLSFALNVLILRAATARLSPELGFPILLATNVTFIGVVALVQSALRTDAPGFDWTATFWFAASGVIGIFLGRRFMVDSVKLLGPARASVLHTASPVGTVIVAWLILGERLGPYELAIIAVVVAGLWFLQPPLGSAALGSAATLGGAPDRRGLLLGVATIAGFSFGNVFRGMGVRDWTEPIIGTLIASAAALACQIAITRNWPALWARLSAADRRGRWWFVASGVASVCGSVFSTAAMAHMEVAMAMMIVYTTPLVIFPVSVFVLGNVEQLRPRTLVGALLALLGVAMLMLR